MISKSQFLKYIQCYKYLWLYKFRRDLLPEEIAVHQQAIFDEGYVVEDYAKKLFSDGVEIEGLFDEAINKTKEEIKKGSKILFQATAKAKSLYSMADVFVYNTKTKKWDIYEVKSSTSVKDIHLIDLAFQKICFESAGYAIGKLHLLHVNNKYVREGDVDIKKLIKINDVTKDVFDIIKQVKLDINEALKLIKKTKEPEIKILKQCNSPYECPFIHYCWKDFPEDNIYSIAGGLSYNKLENLIERGIIDIKDIPDNYLTSKRSILHHKVVKHEKTLIEKDKIKKDLAKLKYPLYFIDYETYSPAVPMFDGYKPYQRIVFQYSLHVLEKPSGKLKHYEYLCQGEKDPTEELSETLKSQIKKPGTFISWNSIFEKGCNREMALRAPKYRKMFEDMNEAMFDLMLIFRKGHYVDKRFRGSASIKKVLPVLVPELSYKDLNIQEGGTASESWARLISKDIKKKDKEKLNKDMLAYCELDTLAMVKIHEFLEKLN